MCLYLQLKAYWTYGQPPLAGFLQGGWGASSVLGRLSLLCRAAVSASGSRDGATEVAVHPMKGFLTAPFAAQERTAAQMPRGTPGTRTHRSSNLREPLLLQLQVLLLPLLLILLLLLLLLLVVPLVHLLVLLLLLPLHTTAASTASAAAVIDGVGKERYKEYRFTERQRPVGCFKVVEHQQCCVCYYRGKEEVQALRLCVGPAGSAPRLEGPFQLSEMME